MSKTLWQQSWCVSLIALCLCLLSCGDEGVLLDGLVPSGPSPLADVRPVPEDIQAILWGPNVDARMAALKETFNSDNDPDGILASFHIHGICLRREQEAYYTKYISAGGVAIMGNGYLKDRFFYAARDIVLGMTQKRPELRELLSPSREDRPGGGGGGGGGAMQPHLIRHDGNRFTTPDPKFRMILVHGYQGYTAVPEYRLGNNTIFYHTPPGTGGFVPSKAWVSVSGGSSLKDRINIYKIFTHEFAHAIHAAIRLIDPTFEDRLEAAYAAAKENGSFFQKGHYALTTKLEYWAVSAEEWFGGLARHSFVLDQFREADPLMYALLDEWFDSIDLSAVESRVYE